MTHSALRFVLSQDISVTIPGLKSVAEVEVAAKTGNEYAGLTAEENKRFTVQLGDYCRDCGACLPCPESIDAAAVLRFSTLAEAYGLREWAGKLYGGLEVKADKCSGCGLCEPKCPYKLPIVKMLREADRALRQ
jgi:uncharacterized protein